VAIAEAEQRLAVLDTEFAAVSQEADMLRSSLRATEARLQELHVRRAEMTAILDRLERNLYEGAKVRKQLEAMKHDGDR